MAVLARPAVNVFYCGAAAVLLLAASGCATRHARRSPEYVRNPRVYPATRYAAGGGVVGQAMDAIGFEYSSGWLLPNNLIQGILLSAVFYGYSLVVEVPISMVTDTAALAFDLRRAAAFREAEHFYRAALLGDGWPETAETLRARHVLIAADRVIREFVAHPDTPETPAKLRALAEAGLGLELVVRSPYVDTDLALRILDQAESAGTDWPRWTVDPNLARATRLRDGQLAGRTYHNTPDYRRMSFAHFLRGQLIRNPALPADALLQILATSEPEATDFLLGLLAEIAYPPDTFEALRLQGDLGVRITMAQNPHVPPAQLAALADDVLGDLTPPVNRVMLNRFVQNPRVSTPTLLRLLELDLLDTPTILKHPAMPASVLRGYADDPRNWHSLLSNSNTPSDVLDIIMADETRGHALDERILGHPNATVQQIIRIMETIPDWEGVSDWYRENIFHNGQVALLNQPDTSTEVLTKYVFRSDHNWVHDRLITHPSADAAFLLAIITNADAFIDVGNAHFLSTKQKGEEALVQRPDATPEQLTTVAALAYKPQTLAPIVEHPNASPETLETVINRCDELIALIPTARDNWRIRNAGLRESVVKDIRESARNRLHPSPPVTEQSGPRTVGP